MLLSEGIVFQEIIEKNISIINLNFTTPLIK